MYCINYRCAPVCIASAGIQITVKAECILHYAATLVRKKFNGKIFSSWIAIDENFPHELF